MNSRKYQRISRSWNRGRLTQPSTNRSATGAAPVHGHAIPAHEVERHLRPREESDPDDGDERDQRPARGRRAVRRRSTPRPLGKSRGSSSTDTMTITLSRIPSTGPGPETRRLCSDPWTCGFTRNPARARADRADLGDFLRADHGAHLHGHAQRRGGGPPGGAHDADRRAGMQPGMGNHRRDPLPDGVAGGSRRGTAHPARRTQGGRCSPGPTARRRRSARSWRP